MGELGKPRITIDWSIVDKLLVSGSSGVQIAAYIGIHKDTLYDRCVIDHDKTFADYSAEKRAKGDSMLLGKQFETAISGNTTMLVWLGKTRLGQTEKVVHDISNPVKELMDQIKNQSKDLVNDPRP